MNILVVDAQGGGIGRQVIAALKKNNVGATILAVGTNSIATQAMLKAGADQAGTGENAVVVASKMADYIIGPIGIVITDSLMGEITETIAAAIGRSSATRLLIPTNQCHNMIMGIEEYNLSKFIDHVLNCLKLNRNGSTGS
ncbi:DUF3842 family protein [Peptoniphilus equinus]|uniref:DUF3842 family protein n=1 Tax=Peptoniphilus equinus TaxID=3016343 RepID=A0ABY7QRB8_9FIRM|nr:DUF3842 family protein [Peptoniphilus equinus]WBW49341.1 DUF3842 family protein [Peptoniphilus equinus]